MACFLTRLCPGNYAYASIGIVRRLLSSYQDTFKRSIERPEEFWSEAAASIEWTRPWSQILDHSNPPFTRWFVGGELNTCYNAIDRHVEKGRGQRTALIYDSPVAGRDSTEPLVRYISYNELLNEVSKFARVLVENGVKKGDRVLIYMPMIPEAVVSMLATARIGGVHSVVFGGFGAKELAKRINHAEPTVIVSASCGIEPTRIVAYKPILNEAIAISSHKPNRCIIVQRDTLQAELKPALDINYSNAIAAARPHDCVPVAATDPIYMLYTSGTTGEPKAIVRPSGGHAVALYWTMKNIYDINPDEVFWTVSDLGWVVGHSYIAYAPLLYGCTSVLYEGKPVGTPDAGAIFRVLNQHNCASVFISPTAVRAIRKDDPKGTLAAKYTLPKLRTFFMAGEICDRDTIHWIEMVINRGSRGDVKQVVDHWWQTESGWPIGATCVGLRERSYTGSLNVGKPVPGWNVQVLNSQGVRVGGDDMGSLAVKLPLPPGAMSTMWRNEERFLKTYFTKFPGFYDTLDTGKIDEEGRVSVMARTDDVINVAGHRLSTGALEECVSSFEEVVECAVVGLEDSVKGQVPLALVVLGQGVEQLGTCLKRDIVEHVRTTVGPVASLKDVVFVPRLPKTRTAKLSRATMQALANGRPFTPPPTLEDPTALEDVKKALAAVGLPRSTEFTEVQVTLKAAKGKDMKFQVQVTSNALVCDGMWHQIKAVVDNTEVTLEVDGKTGKLCQ